LEAAFNKLPCFHGAASSTGLAAIALAPFVEVLHKQNLTLTPVSESENPAGGFAARTSRVGNLYFRLSASARCGGHSVEIALCLTEGDQDICKVALSKESDFATWYLSERQFTLGPTKRRKSVDFRKRLGIENGLAPTRYPYKIFREMVKMSAEQASVARVRAA
jgi:hypothetical protein